MYPGRNLRMIPYIRKQHSRKYTQSTDVLSLARLCQRGGLQHSCRHVGNGQVQAIATFLYPKSHCCPQTMEGQNHLFAPIPMSTNSLFSMFCSSEMPLHSSPVSPASTVAMGPSYSVPKMSCITGTLEPNQLRRQYYGIHRVCFEVLFVAVVICPFLLSLFFYLPVC
ncbi:hypothetical protein J3A83DRAFT_1691206 [Scleroderma citrinum]